MNSVEYVYYRDEANKNPKSKSGVKDSKIVEVKNFLDIDKSERLISFLESDNREWGNVAFDKSFGSRIDIEDSRLEDFGFNSKFFFELQDLFYKEVEKVFEVPVIHNTIHAQKWVVGGYANPHSDNSDENGEPNGFDINKYVAILYLNDNYSGGQIYFPDHGIEFRPSAGSLVIFSGGIDNVHGVKPITNGVRHTIVSFWNFA